jgi:Domain of unknown function (DUF4159)
MMAIPLVCPSCSQTIIADSAAAGQTAQCPSCGGLLHVPIPAQVRRPKSRNSVPLILGVSLAVALLIVGGIIIALLISNRSGPLAVTTPDPEVAWEQSHRAELIELKTAAESQALSGDLSAAHETYQKLQSLAAAHSIQDSALLDLIQTARQDQERIYALLLARPQSPPPAVEQPTVLPATPQTDVITVAPPTTAPAETPPIVATIIPATLTDQRIHHALSNGIGYLISKFKDGEIDDGQPKASVMHQGLNALCVYALLHASEGTGDPRLDINQPFLQNLIEKMKASPMRGDPAQQQSPVTYARSLRAAALAAYNRPEDHDALIADVQWLIHAANAGAYTYDDRFANLPTSDASDNSSLPESKGSDSQQASDARLPVGRGSIGTNSLPPPGTSIGPGVVMGQTSQAPQPWVGYFEHGTIYHPSAHGYPPFVGGAHPFVGGAHPFVGGLRPFDGQMLPYNGPIPTPSNTRQYAAAPADPQPFNSGVTQPPPAYQPLQSDAPTPTGPAYPQQLAGAPWDNSNSQYGLLGVWAGAEVGITVPATYWQAVQKHWLTCELSNGQWFYSLGSQLGTQSMTCAGIVSLLITHEWLDPPAQAIRVGRPPYSTALDAGLNWLETADNLTAVITPDTHYVGYNLYGIERCALASGFKYFGQHNWYLELAEQIVPMQFANGAWGHEQDGTQALIDTSYIVLFLSRGQHPIIMNKLKFDPYWDNRPRDIANLAHYASHELQRPINWQVVDLQRPWSDWMDSPILYIASHAPPKFTDADYDQLRSFADAGGMIFTHADGASDSFNTWVADLAKKLWPQYPLTDIPATHDLFTVDYHLSPPPKLQMVTNGTRLLLVHSPVDISAPWQTQSSKIKKEPFELGVNLFVYGAGRGTFRNRLDSPYIPEPTGIASSTITIGRLRYDGSWNPEPYAWTRFARYFQWNTNIALKIETIDLQDLKFGDTQIATLTGTTPTDFSAAQINAVKSFVDAGGTLLIDAAGGSSDFAASVEQHLLAKAFPNIQPQEILGSDTLLKSDEDLSHPQLRQYAMNKLNRRNGPLVQSLTSGKGRVIYSPLDLTTALLGTNSWGILGYTPAYAQSLIKNLLLVY